ncbi:PREDICTED: berberine bridge enzyme-like 4 [Camelina sativa]|uniref:Berberine bridge enzyme-like 4 n=1 Tax=Camelina sativa TaxID=90675 RepID=A0ABM1QID3_CAMSA|nr:PREDICTED: berberine bridge enzyme-like 4 [Camelina sativa]
MKEVVVLVYVLLLVLFVSVSNAKVTKTNIIENFLQCLHNQTRSENPIIEAVCTHDNSTFVSSYVSYTKNKRYSNPKDTKVIAIVAAKHESHVQATVVCAKSNRIQIRIRSGGHDYEGLSYISSVPFVILDMHDLRSIIIDVSKKQAWVNAGATLGELYTKISKASKTLAFPAGVCSTLGAGGHISGGGYGNLMRKYGISVDNVVDARVVDVNGNILTGATLGDDLLWAIRGGGGGSFGVILSWKINLVDVPETVTVFKVNKTLEKGATDVLYKWQLVSSKLPQEFFLRAMPELQNVAIPSKITIAVVFYAQFLGPAKKLMEIINKNLPELGLKREDCYEMSWINTTTFWQNYPVGTSTSFLLDRPTDPPGAFFKSKSDYVKKPIPKEGMEKIWKIMLKFNNMFMQWNPYGGAMDKIPANATAFPHRNGNLYKIQYFALWTDANATDANVGLMKEIYEAMEPYVSSNPRGAFLNYRDMDIGSNPSGKTNVEEAKIYGSKYFLGNLKRLMQVKAKYDPENFFRFEQSIPPIRAM